MNTMASFRAVQDGMAREKAHKEWWDARRPQQQDTLGASSSPGKIITTATEPQTPNEAINRFAAEHNLNPDRSIEEFEKTERLAMQRWPEAFGLKPKDESKTQTVSESPIVHFSTSRPEPTSPVVQDSKVLMPEHVTINVHTGNATRKGIF